MRGRRLVPNRQIPVCGRRDVGALVTAVKIIFDEAVKRRKRSLKVCLS